MKPDEILKYCPEKLEERVFLFGGLLWHKLVL